MPQTINTGKRPPRAKLSQPVRIRPYNSNLSPDVCVTQNVSRKGFYFESSEGHYFVGMYVYVTRNYNPDDRMGREETGDVVRVERLKNGKWGVAVRMLPGVARP